MPLDRSTSGHGVCGLARRYAAGKGRHGNRPMKDGELVNSLETRLPMEPACHCRSKRSLVATSTFMTTGFATQTAIMHKYAACLYVCSRLIPQHSPRSFRSDAICKAVHQSTAVDQFLANADTASLSPSLVCRRCGRTHVKWSTTQTGISSRRHKSDISGLVRRCSGALRLERWELL